MNLASRRESEGKVLADIFDGKSDPINAELFDIYQEDYFNGIEQVFGNPKPYTSLDKLKQQFRLNMSRFAAAKTYMQTSELKDLANGFEALDEFQSGAKPVMNKYRRWQAVESHTMTARCRSAKQFSKFLDEDAPNIEWLMTRSAHPREAHLAFVGKILPKDHPFWIDNQPGNLYECKCDWRTTYESASEAPTEEVIPPKGLEGNPAVSGVIFTKKHPYVNKLTRKGRKALEAFTYDDDGIAISVIADKSEIAENLYTARILSRTYKNVLVQSHVRARVNPEFKVNGLTADAKRIEKYSGITKGCNRAFNKQNCDMCIIDFNMNFDVSKAINTDVVTGLIMRRYRDIENGKSIVIVFGNESIEINKNNFKKHEIRSLLNDKMPKP